MEIEKLWQARLGVLSGLHDWFLAGRVVIKSQGKAWHFGLRWRQIGPNYTLELRTALGQMVASLNKGPGGVVLRVGDEAPLIAANAQILLESRFAWRMPVSKLVFWVIGRVENGSVSGLKLDSIGVPFAATDAGWNIQYRRYDTWQGLLLPEFMVFSRRDTEIRLVVSDWDIKGDVKE